MKSADYGFLAPDHGSAQAFAFQTETFAQSIAGASAGAPAAARREAAAPTTP